VQAAFCARHGSLMQPAEVAYVVNAKEECSFLKKRTKKISLTCTHARSPARAQQTRVFLLLFLQKKKNLAYAILSPRMSHPMIDMVQCS
jgi:hypothetical protein